MECPLDIRHLIAQFVHEPEISMSAYQTNSTERLGLLRAFQEEVAKINLLDDDEFQRIIREAQTILEMTEREIADQLSVSRPTVNRWKNGKNLPYNAMRKYVSNWIDQQLGSKIRLLEYNMRQSGASAQTPPGKMVALAYR